MITENLPFNLNVPRYLFLVVLCIKIKVKEISNFGQKLWTNLFGKNQIFSSSYKQMLLWSLQASFLSRMSKTLFLHQFLTNTQKKKISTFWPKSWTITFAIMSILRSFKSLFLSSKKASFQTITSANSFSRMFLIKEKFNKIWNFGPKPWTNSLKKTTNFVGFWNRCFYGPDRPVFDIKRQKSFFCDSFLRFITCGYRGLQGVTGGYKGLRGVTGSYKGLQGVTKGYKGLQLVPGGPKILQKTCFLISTSPDTFSFCIVHKNQS